MKRKKQKMLSDEELVNFLIDKCATPALAARDLGVTKQRLFNWRRRGIAFRYRPVFRIVANRHGANLPRTWLDVSVPSISAPKDAPVVLPETKDGHTDITLDHEERLQKLERYIETLERGIASLMRVRP